MTAGSFLRTTHRWASLTFAVAVVRGF